MQHTARIDGASGFYRFLVFQYENCLPTSPRVCGGCGRQEGQQQGWGLPGSAWGPCALSGGAEPKPTNGPGETNPPTQNIQDPPSPRRAPGEEPLLYSPFLQNYFFSSFLGALGGDLGRGRGGVAEGLPRGNTRDPRCLRPAWLRALSRYTAL